MTAPDAAPDAMSDAVPDPVPSAVPISAAPGFPGPDGDNPEGATFRELFLAEFGAMVALARLLGSDDPEDTAQEAFCRLHSRWARLHDPAAATGYLRTTVVNLSRNRVRHLAVRRRHRESIGQQQIEQPSAEAQVLDRQQVEAVLAGLRRLPERQREAIVLRYWLDLPYADIAATAHRPSSTVRSDVRRGLTRLASVLGDGNGSAIGGVSGHTNAVTDTDTISDKDDRR